MRYILALILIASTWANSSADTAPDESSSAQASAATAPQPDAAAPAATGAPPVRSNLGT